MSHWYKKFKNNVTDENKEYSNNKNLIKQAQSQDSDLDDVEGEISKSHKGSIGIMKGDYIGNQRGEFFKLYDPRRSVLDAYDVSLAMSRHKDQVTVSILATHGFLGSVTWNEYWIFDLETEIKRADKLYYNLREVILKLMNKFLEEGIPTSTFWPMLKANTIDLEPDAKMRTNIPIINYNRNNPGSGDWRQNIYGTKYPENHETSYEKHLNQGKKS